jgi:hypothetical protein
MADPAQKEGIVQTYVQIASAKPVPRQPFRRRQQEVEKKAERK